MKLKILTANIAFGLPKMNNILVNIVGHFYFHRLSMATLFVNPKSLKDAKAYTNQSRVDYLKKHSSLSNTLELISNENADIVSLNELILPLHKEELEQGLSAMGYKSWTWGASEHYPDTTVASFIASKFPAEPISINFPQDSHVGGGGGMAAIRLSDSSITAASVHVCASDKFPWLYEKQIFAIAKFVKQEQQAGRKVIIAGDWNAPSQAIQKFPEFLRLKLKNAEGNLLTCPTFLPWLQPLDHIFIPENLMSLNPQIIAFDSDHLAVSLTAIMP